jgi:hypothetical protein
MRTMILFYLFLYIDIFIFKSLRKEQRRGAWVMMMAVKKFDCTDAVRYRTFGSQGSGQTVASCAFPQKRRPIPVHSNWALTGFHIIKHIMVATVMASNKDTG